MKAVKPRSSLRQVENVLGFPERCRLAVYAKSGFSKSKRCRLWFSFVPGMVFWCRNRGHRATIPLASLCPTASSASSPNLRQGVSGPRLFQHKEHKGVDAKNAKAWRDGKPLRSLCGFPLRSLREKVVSLLCVREVEGKAGDGPARRQGGGQGVDGERAGGLTGEWVGGMVGA